MRNVECYSSLLLVISYHALIHTSAGILCHPSPQRPNPTLRRYKDIEKPPHLLVLTVLSSLDMWYRMSVQHN